MTGSKTGKVIETAGGCGSGSGSDSDSVPSSSWDHLEEGTESESEPEPEPQPPAVSMTFPVFEPVMAPLDPLNVQGLPVEGIENGVTLTASISCQCLRFQY